MKIIESNSTSYAPRTYANAYAGDVTIALAVDYGTAGEKLTKKAAGSRYLALPINEENTEIPADAHVDTLVSYMDRKKVNTINVAGNGIYTLSRRGWTQSRINQYLYDILSAVHKKHPISHIYNGGQTGVDIAGAVAGEALGIPVTIHMPRGLKQRFEDGVDVPRDPKDIYFAVKEMAKHITPPSSAPSVRM